MHRDLQLMVETGNAKVLVYRHGPSRVRCICLIPGERAIYADGRSLHDVYALAVDAIRQTSAWNHGAPIVRQCFHQNTEGER